MTTTRDKVVASRCHSPFVGSVKDVYTRSQGRLKANQALRLIFDIATSESDVALLPWEFQADPDQGSLALLDAPIMRYLPQQAVMPPLA